MLICLYHFHYCSFRSPRLEDLPQRMSRRTAAYDPRPSTDFLRPFKCRRSIERRSLLHCICLSVYGWLYDLHIAPLTCKFWELYRWCWIFFGSFLILSRSETSSTAHSHSLLRDFNFVYETQKYEFVNFSSFSNCHTTLLEQQAFSCISLQMCAITWN